MRTPVTQSRKHDDPLHYATLEEVAARLGVSTFAVWQTEQRALRKLKASPLLRQLALEAVNKEGAADGS